MLMILWSLLSLSPAHATEVTTYGFVKASAMSADNALTTYNNVNLSAPTAAFMQETKEDKRDRLSFQTQQSRLGFILKQNEKVSGKIETDFIDFNRSSPAQQAIPRIRIASVTYKKNENETFILGHDWDLFSPTTTYTYDYVGLYFLAGNTGFMRQQFQYLNKHDDLEIGAALGMAGSNVNPTDADLEKTNSPSYSFRIAKGPDAANRYGLSAIYARLNYTSNDTKHESTGLNLFYEHIYSRFAVKSEIYQGQNLANIGSLSIGKGTDTKNAKEVGGFVSGKYTVDEKHFIFGGVGEAHATNKKDYGAFAAPLVPGGAVANLGIVSNQLSRIGYECVVDGALSLMAEVSFYNTRYKLAESDYKTYHAHSVEVGANYKF